MADRRERVIFEAVDNYTSDVARMAAATKLLRRELKSADSDTAKLQRSIDGLSRQSLPDMNRRMETSGASIDRYSGRLGLLARGIGALGPAAVPITTSVVPALAMLTSGIGSTALGAGVLVVAFQGVGDALKAVNKAQLQPTTKNLEAAREAMQNLSPAARDAVRALQAMRPVLQQIRDAGAAGFFPGFVRGLHELEAAAPQVERIFNKVGEAAGGIFEDTAGWVTGPEGAAFLSFVEDEAPSALTKFADAAGNVGAGLADLVMAMDPLSDFGLDGLVNLTEQFRGWADSLSQTEGYREFIDYVRETGPQVLDTVGSLANAILQIGEAAAPLGGPVLHALEGIADAVAEIADSPLGPSIMTAVSAMSALSLATRTFGSVATTSWAMAARGQQGYIAQLSALKSGMKVGAGIAALGVANAAGLDTTYTVLGAMAGSVIPGVGTAAGAATGSLLDMASAFHASEVAARDFDSALASGNVDQIRAAVEAKQKEVDDYTDSLRSKIRDALSFMGPDADSTYTNSGQLKQAQDALADAENRAAHAAGFATAAERDHAQALMAVHDAALQAMNSELSWEQALLTANKTVRENGRVVDENGNALRGHEQAAIDSHQAILRVAAAWNEQARAGDGTTKELDRTKAAIRRMATEAGFGEDEIRRMIKALDAVPPKTKAQIELEAQGAIQQILTFRQYLNSLHDKTITINAVRGGYHGAVQGNKQMAQQDRYGDYAYGGFTGTGGKFEPAGVVHRGEVVIPQELVQRDWSMLRSRYGHLPGFADGGVVGGGSRGHDDASGVRSLGDEAKKSAKEIQKEREQRHKARVDAAQQRVNDAKSLLDQRTQERDQFGSSVADRFRSDLFAPSQSRGSGWYATSAPKSDWRTKLLADIAQAGEVNSLQAQLRGAGLDGAAAQALFANADVSTLREFAAMGPAGISDYESLYGQREALLGSAGAGAGEAVFGSGVSAAQQQLNQASAELASMKRGRRGRGPNRHQRESFRNRDRHHGGTRAAGGGGRGGKGRPVYISVEGDSSRDPMAMAQETARRLAFEGD